MLCWRVWVSLWLLCGGVAGAQITLREALSGRKVARALEASPADTVPVAPPATLTEALYRTSAQAGIIFLGEITSVEPQGTALRVSFHVESAVRGVQSGQTYVMREWSGASAGFETQYRKGQRMLVMLHTPSAAGLSSPVGGSDGLIPLHGDATTGSLDLRWLAAGIARAFSAGAPAPSPKQHPFLTDRALSATTPMSVAEPQPDGAVKIAAEQIPLQPESLDSALVLEMLRAMTARPGPVRIR